MVLTDTDIKKILCTEVTMNDSLNKLRIYPYCQESLTPVGYDIRIGKQVSTKGKIYNYKEGQEIKFKPNTPVLVSSLEEIQMPNNKKYSAIVASKVSQTAKGISHDLTTIDPDWKGTLLLSLVNNSSKEVKLKVGDQICTLVFFENKTEATLNSNKQENRNDIYLRQWTEASKKLRIRHVLNRLLPPLIIVSALIGGYFCFGINHLLTATVAVGIALSQLAKFE